MELDLGIEGNIPRGNAFRRARETFRLGVGEAGDAHEIVFAFDGDGVGAAVAVGVVVFGRAGGAGGWRVAEAGELGQGGGGVGGVFGIGGFGGEGKGGGVVGGVALGTLVRGLVEDDRDGTSTYVSGFLS